MSESYTGCELLVGVVRCATLDVVHVFRRCPNSVSVGWAQPPFAHVFERFSAVDAVQAVGRCPTVVVIRHHMWSGCFDCWRRALLGPGPSAWALPELSFQWAGRQFPRFCSRVRALLVGGRWCRLGAAYQALLVCWALLNINNNVIHNSRNPGIPLII